MSEIHIVTLGSAGLGLVWGWIIGNLSSQVQKPMRSIPFLVLAVVAISAIVLWFTDWTRVYVFLASGALSMVTHVAWRYSLMGRNKRLTRS